MSPRPAERRPEERTDAGEAPALVCVARIVTPHGVRGEVKLTSFTADASSLRRFKRLRADGAGDLDVVALRPSGGDPTHFLARFKQIDSREAADALRGALLHVPRAALDRVEEDEFYVADLMGCRVEGVAGEPFGEVIAVENFGAGDVIEIARDGRTAMLPFAKDFVPLVDLDGRRIVVASDPFAPEERDGVERT